MTRRTRTCQRKEALPTTLANKVADVVDEVPDNLSCVEEGMVIDDFNGEIINQPQLFNIEDFEEVEVPDAPQTVSCCPSDQSRLMITHIVIENFKSYAGVQSLGPFHKSFTSIVGPNGSGKSNVIDSMLFVFGYRASKIRSKKVSVLIHNSELYKDIDSCSVSVHFQRIVDTGPGDTDYRVIPDTQIIVCRSAYKDNTSSYSVNGKRTTYKDVAILLRASGIDLDHNRFLILQGEVELIAMMKPKAITEHEDGMLEFLEDIIGSNRFRKSIETLSQRIEVLNDFRAEKLNRVKVVEKEKDDLENVKDEAVAYLTAENEIVRLSNRLYQKYICELSVDEQKAQADVDSVNSSMKTVKEKMGSIAARKREKEKECKLIKKKYESLTKQVEETKEKFAELEKQDFKCQEDFKHVNTKTKKLENVLELDRKKVLELRHLPEKNEMVIAELNLKVEELENEKVVEEEKVKEVMCSIQSETKPLQDEKEKLEGKLLEFQKSVNEKKSILRVTESELEMFVGSEEKEKIRLQDLQRTLDDVKAEIEEHEIQITQLRKNIPNLQHVVEKASENLKRVCKAGTSASEQVRKLRFKAEEFRSLQQSASRRGKVLGFLLDLKNSGEVPGIMGRLGDLGAIDEEYDVAVSTACGPLDNIVVDCIDTGQHCVELLTKHDVGVATFIGLDKMQKWKEISRKKIATPENVPRLFDLIKVRDKNILPAFYFALRDTLVAKDLDQATGIAYGKSRYRVVTLQGQLIDQSGTMSGGGKTVSRGRMGSSVVSDGNCDPKQLSDIEKELDVAQKEAEACELNRLHLEDVVCSDTNSLSEMKQNLMKAEMKSKGMQVQVTDLKSQIQQQEQKAKASVLDAKQLATLQKKVDTYRKDYEKCANLSSKVEMEVQRLHQQIMDIGGSKLQACEAKVASVSGLLDEVVGHITKARAAIKTSQRNLQKAEDKVLNVEEELAQSCIRSESLNKLFKELEQQATVVLEAHQEAKDKFVDIESSLQVVQAARKQLEEEEGECQKENLDVQLQLEKLENIFKQTKAKLNHWKKELASLRLTPVEGDDDVALASFTASELDAVVDNDLKFQITVLQEKLTKMKPNIASIAEYKKKEELYIKRVGELDDITEVREKQRRCHADLRKKRLDEFMLGFCAITGKLKEMYQMITLGGDAELELVDSLDPFSEGIVFSVRPPKKSWKNISNLSGGEKTLSSLALVFALHHYKPTPLYIMDEIDAALDFKNVSIVANYIKERTKNAQFIIISLRNNMFELADRLVGVYKTYNCTKSVTLNPHCLQLPSCQAVDRLENPSDQQAMA